MMDARLVFLMAMTCATAACGGKVAEQSGTTVAGDSNNASNGESSGNRDHTGGADARESTPNPTARAFGAACASSADCDSNVCFVGGHGGFCSLRCAADVSCPTSSSGAPHCNPRGYCRW
jgi:hypothetical protein